MKFLYIADKSISTTCKILNKPYGYAPLNKLMDTMLRRDLFSSEYAKAHLYNKLNELVILMVMDNALGYIIRQDDVGFIKHLSSVGNSAYNLSLRTYLVNMFIDENKAVLDVDDYWNFHLSISTNLTYYINLIINEDHDNYKQALLRLYEYLAIVTANIPMPNYSLLIINNQLTIVLPGDTPV